MIMTVQLGGKEDDPLAGLGRAQSKGEFFGRSIIFMFFVDGVY